MPGFSTETRLDGTSEFKLDRNGACAASRELRRPHSRASCSVFHTRVGS